ncbi:hypothetical protein Golax_020617 [Gossypium laxum]|uniref:Uncharacterized protein n=1 Tax=Gossypium laxum TaxID=34288 RepID=A0A7J9B185_9ROSI|nr:hypothetical protein [Gossypium laxum]
MNSMVDLIASQLKNEASKGDLNDADTRPADNVKFPQIFREYNMEYKPIIVGLLEPRISGAKVDRIIAKLGFQRSHHVKAIGYSRGI